MNRREFMALAAGSLSVAAAPVALAKVVGEKPLLKIAVLSDVQGYPYPEDAGMRNLERALDVLAPLKPDLVVNVGDINDSGCDMDAVRYFKARCDARLGKLPHVACNGNHEICFIPGELKATRTPQACLAEFNAVFGQEPSPVVERTIGGYDFIALGMTDAAGYPESHLKLLRDALDRAVRRGGAKPVFVLAHYHPYDTVGSSGDRKGTSGLREVLNGYPQVVNLSGHSHCPLQDPRSIWQGAFTAVETCTLCYGCVEQQEHSSNRISDLIPYGHESVGFVFVEVYADRLVVRRFTARDRRELEPAHPWTVSLPYDPKRPQYDFASRAAAVVPPQFPAEVEPTLWYDYGYLYLMFAAAADPASVYSYRVELAEEGGKAVSCWQLADFYRLPEHREKRIVFRVPPKVLRPGGRYRCRIFPVGFFGREGRPCEWTFAVKPGYPLRTTEPNLVQE